MKLFVALAALVAVATATPAPGNNSTLEARGCGGTGGWDPNCKVPGEPDRGVIDTVYRVGVSRHLTEREMVATFMTMRVESNYHNLHCGHADSIGVFQQRPCAEVWGSYNEILNVVHAANAFMDAMTACSKRMPGNTAGQIAQCAQQSELPYAYDQAAANAKQELAAARKRNGGYSGGGGDGGAQNPAPPPPPKSVKGCTKTVKVKSGDKCADVAGRGDISVDQLRKLNTGITDSCGNIKVGADMCVSTEVPKPIPTDPPKKCKSRYNAPNKDRVRRSLVEGSDGILRVRYELAAVSHHARVLSNWRH